MAHCLTDAQKRMLNLLQNYAPELRREYNSYEFRMGDFLEALCQDLDVVSITQNHTTVLTPELVTHPPGQEPTIAAHGNLVLAEFTLNTDAGYRVFKLPGGGITAASAHVHWTKTDDVNRQGQTVRWRLTYTVVNGEDEDGSAVGTSVEFEDTYEDAGTTTRIVHRTLDVPLSGLTANYYIAMKIEALTPGSGTPVTEPGLVTMDLKYS